MRGEPKISGVYGMGEYDEPTEADKEAAIEQARKDIWHKLGLAVLDPEDERNEFQRLALIQAAESRYGRRRGKGKK